MEVGLGLPFPSTERKDGPGVWHIPHTILGGSSQRPFLCAFSPMVDSASRARFRPCKCSAFSLPTNARRGYGTLHSLPSGGGRPSPLSASCSRSRQRSTRSRLDSHTRGVG